MTKRKKLYYMDLTAVENGTHLSRLEQLTHERLMTSRDWDALIFWLDLEAALETLNEYQRTCFVANLIEGYSKQDIATRLRVTRQAVLKQICIARKKIKKFLSEGYETP